MALSRSSKQILRTKEGVQFKFECVSGLCSATNSCFLADADDIGSGNSLQSIHQLFILLRQVIDGNPKVRKTVIVTPINVSSNWEAEIMKWAGSVGKRVRFVTLCESTGDDVLSSLNSFASPGSHLQVLIVSNKTYQMHLSKFGGSGSCDLLICDEAHMLKSDQTLTNQTPNICGREPSATEDEKLGIERSAELSVKDNQVNVVKDGKLAQQHCARKQAVPSVSMRAV